MKNSFAILLLFVLVNLSKQLYVNTPNDLEADQIIRKNLMSKRVSRNDNSSSSSSESSEDEATNVGSGEAPHVSLKKDLSSVSQVRIYETQSQDNFSRSSGEEPIKERVKRQADGSGEQISFNADPTVVNFDNGSGQEVTSI